MSDATRVAIVGLGAIGGSVALKLLSRGITPRGFTTSPADHDLAAVAGVSIADTVNAAIAGADLILIAVPLDQLGEVARAVMSAAPNTATVLHAASLQRPSATGLTGECERVIGTHPLAGSVRGGFAAASADMFKGAIIYAEPRGTRRNREDVELFWSLAGAARIEYLDATEHDDHMAAVSHVPQLLASALASVLARAQVAASDLGPGGRDMTRLAGSSWSMWAPLISATPERTTQLLEQIVNELSMVRSAIEHREVTGLKALWNRAGEWQRID